MKLIFIAFLAAILAALLGAFAGGGMGFVLIPLLILSLGTDYLTAVTLTKLSIVTMTFTAFLIHRKKQKLSLPLFLSLIVFGLLGMALGTYILEFHLNEELFRTILGVLLISTAIYFLHRKEIGVKGKERKLTPMLLLELAVFMTAIMVMGAIFGGAGIPITAYLVIRFRMNFIKASAYTMASSFITTSAQSLYLLSFVELQPWMIVAVVAGALFGGLAGVKLQYLKGSKWVKLASISVMLVIGVQSLFF